MDAQVLVDDGAPRWLAVTWIVQTVDAGVEPTPAPVRQFADVGDDHQYVAYIERAAELGITQGCGDGTRFCPDDTVTQGQMAAFLERGSAAVSVAEPVSMSPVSMSPVSKSQGAPDVQQSPIPTQSPVPQQSPIVLDDPVRQETPVVQETGDFLRHDFYYVDRVGVEALEVSMDVLANDDCVMTCDVSINYAPKVGTTTWDPITERLTYEVPQGTPLPSWSVAIGYETNTSPWNAIATIVFNEIPQMEIPQMDAGRTYQQMAVGDNFWCGISDEVGSAGNIECQGNNDDGQLDDIPSGSDFAEISAGGATTEPDVQFKQLSAGDAITCGIKMDDTIMCWGDTEGTVPDGAFESLVTTGKSTCALRGNGVPSCWGGQFKN